VGGGGIHCADAWITDFEELFMSKANEALDRMAENARELGLDYEPDGRHHNKPQKRPQNCGTGFCSCIECVMEPAQRTWVGLTDEEYTELWGMKPDLLNFVRKIEAKLKEKNATAQPTVPDALTTADKESPEYTQGWNDCRAEMLRGRGK
jgi:hypothetical protein